jgi:putative transcriptional regulator
VSFCLKNYFLVATQSLRGDDYFEHSVVYIYKHDAAGAEGFIINRPLDVEFKTLLQHLKLAIPQHDIEDNSLIYLGGASGQDVGTLVYTEDDKVTAASVIKADPSRANLEAMLANQLKNFMFVLGNTLWKPNQLETELAGDKWLAVPADARVLFETPVPQRWSKAAHLLGISSVHLSGSGNA